MRRQNLHLLIDLGVQKDGLYLVELLPMMRSEAQIKSLLLDFARNEERIRAVLLNGSRANSTIFKNEYQDFDVVYVVKALDDFTKNHQWIDALGETVITQLPDQMVIGETKMESK
ncbi:aminoglycoside 6-adenylyltransferase [Spirosoma agri]|uniref:Aminoglycoside 6-adenylyltransferase n=1 Tax=Spirosoma agri TaxID=1987381 RepID=A0A6M0IKE7_9BACT|nr:aminoglycoside 6-adenylyltransferase [Spirosoma agri]NEU67413.1 aminoglycoside 6-adenylyltransferase [Spirosoma agri]